MDELKKKLGNIGAITIALDLLRASKLTKEETSELEIKIVGLMTYLMTLHTNLDSKEADFKHKMLGEKDEKGKSLSIARIEIEWNSTEEGKELNKVSKQIKILDEQLKCVRNYNYHLRSESKL